jgi:hypothetical protein
VSNPPLKPLHPESVLVAAKLDQFGRIPTEILLQTLLPGQKDSLKTRPDGTILDGHHRIKVLKSRGVNVDALPRDVIVRE